MELRFGVFRLSLEGAFVFLDHLLQRAEIQALVIRRQAEHGVGRCETHRLFAVLQHRPEQQAALGSGDQSDHALDRRFAHQCRGVLQVRVGQFQGAWAGVVGQLGMQGGPAGVRQVGARQLLIKHPRGPGQTIVSLLERLTVIDVRRLGAG